jgi:RND family efflux transporter MFP subunit
MIKNIYCRGLHVRRWWFLALALVFFCLTAGLFSVLYGNFLSASQASKGHSPNTQGPIQVCAKTLCKAKFERVTVQPGSVEAFKSIHLYARASGYLKEQLVDIEDTVKEGQVLAVLDVPDLDKQVQHHRAILEQTVARVKQLKAKVNSAKAELVATKAAVDQAEASARSAKATLQYLTLKKKRIIDLFEKGGAEEKFVDEVTAQHEAGVEKELAAKAGIVTAKSRVIAQDSKIEEAEADVIEGEAQVKVARADLQKSQVMLSFATITAPFDGVITRRNLDVGDFVHSAGSTGDKTPLFTIAKMDMLRVIVQIPDQYVPYANKGDIAYVEIDALPGRKTPAKISRIAQSEDPKTRYMHVEIDLSNPDFKIVPGMYGKVTVILDEVTNHLSLPGDCLVGQAKGGKGKVFVDKGGKARLITVQLGLANGTDREVLAGLTAEDRVIVHPPPTLTDGAAVIETEHSEASSS